MDATAPLLSPAQLRRLSDAVLVDARPGTSGLSNFERAHLPGARHVDLDRDLSGPASHPERGGRHPLPDVSLFASLLGNLGIAPTTHVVVYDDQGGAHAAARLWWLLRAVGHERVHVLDGGLAAALRAGMSTESSERSHDDAADAPEFPPYPATGFDHMPHVDAAFVEQARTDPQQRVLDVRAAARFCGAEEPIDPVAGHIPGAHNIPFEKNLAPDGCFLTPAALRPLYAPLLGDRPPVACVVHCGSGVTACHTLLALEHAGLKGAALYVGSWSEWCRNPWPREP